MRSLLRSPVDLAVIVLLSLLLFVAFFDVAMLAPRNIGWLLRGSDSGENALGLHAWLNDPHATLFRTYLLNAPDGVTLLFTDSNPLLALLVAPLARLAGGDLQVVGPWLLACLILQLSLARALLSPYAPSRVMLWIGVILLTLLPSLFLRQVHVNLCAHWLLLWALWIFIDPRRAADGRWWLAVVVCAALVHSYLLLMVAAIWGSAMLERWICLEKGWAGRRNLLLGAAGVAIAAATCVFLLVDRGGLVPTHSFGQFGMPIDAPWNPAIGGLARFLPAYAQAPDRQMEAFQYLGAGLLLLIAAMPFSLATGRETIATTGSLHRRLCWLIPAGTVLTMLAITHRIDYAGVTLVHIPLSATMVAALDPIRASARLFWPVAYGLVFAAITAAYRLPPARGQLLLAVALAVQVLDLGGLAHFTRATASGARDPSKWIRTRDPRWAMAISAAHDVTIMPPNAVEQLDLFQELAWRAVDAGRPIRLVYASRSNEVTKARLKREEEAFDRGDLDPHRLYVLLPQAKLPKVAADRVAMLDGVRVILPRPDGRGKND